MILTLSLPGGKLRYPDGTILRERTYMTMIGVGSAVIGGVARDVKMALGNGTHHGERIDALARSASLQVYARMAMLAMPVVGTALLGVMAWLLIEVVTLDRDVTGHTVTLQNIETEISARVTLGDGRYGQITTRLDNLSAQASALSRDAAAAKEAATGVQRQIDANHAEAKETADRLQQQLQNISAKLEGMVFDLSRVKAQVLCKGRPSDC